jgi:hypothetical protein
MTDHQITLLAAALSAGAPMLAVVVGILVNNSQIGSIREDIREIRRDLKDLVAKVGAMDVELGKLMDKVK